MNFPETHAKMQFYLTNNERKRFIGAVTRLVERGKFSKNSSLARTAAMVSSSLAYIEPSLMLPSCISQFQTALDSVSLQLNYLACTNFLLYLLLYPTI